jgi:hypothetical protein
LSPSLLAPPVLPFWLVLFLLVDVHSRVRARPIPANGKGWEECCSARLAL